MTIDPIDVGKKYLNDHDVSPDTFFRYPLVKEPRFAGTPTLAVLDADRRIIGVWLGKLTEIQEQEVERAFVGAATR